MPLSDEHLAIVTRALDPDETVLWADQPSAKRLLLRMIWRTGWMGLPLVLISVISGLALLGGGLNGFNIAFFFVVLSNLVALLLSTVLAYFRTVRSGYVLTNRRGLVAGPDGGELRVRSFTGAAMRVAEMKRRRDGSGDLIFDQPVTAFDWMSTHHSRGQIPTGRVVFPPDAFLGIDEVERVYGIIRRLGRFDDEENPEQTTELHWIHERRFRDIERNWSD